MTHGDEHVLQSMPGALVVVDVVRRDDTDAKRLRELDQRPVARPVAVDEVVL